MFVQPESRLGIREARLYVKKEVSKVKGLTSVGQGGAGPRRSLKMEADDNADTMVKHASKQTRN